ncbi:ribonuclease P protein component [Myxococcota bacterium]|jgi:ribonuclease P protein component|nr:ribonuclease P protein component [Myxococcota bacterium]
MGLPRCRRVLSKRDFERAMRSGRRVRSRNLVLYAVANEGGTSRLGLAVSRKVDERAVGRNRWKRLIRDIFRTEASASLPAVDVVVVVRPPEAAPDPGQGRKARRQAPDRDALARELTDALRRMEPWNGLGRPLAVPVPRGPDRPL